MRSTTDANSCARRTVVLGTARRGCDPRLAIQRMPDGRTSALQLGGETHLAGFTDERAPLRVAQDHPGDVQVHKNLRTGHRAVKGYSCV